MSEKFTDLKTLRESSGWTQDQLAKASGYSKSYICMIESGARPMTEEVSDKIALGVAKLTREDGLRRAKVKAAVDSAFRNPNLARLRRRYAMRDTDHDT